MELAVGAKILAFLPFPAKSHHIAFQPIIRELANRGHRVDFYTPIKLPNPPKSLKQIMIKDILSDIHGSLNMKQLMTQTIMRNSQTISELCIMVAERLFNEEPKLAELVKSNATYDAVILELHFGQEYQAALIHKFKALGIAVVPLLDSAWVNELAGLPDNPSYMIDFKMVATDKMSFFERLQNLYTWAGTNLVSYYFAMTKQQELADRYIRDYEGWESRPSVLQLSSDVALILSNSHRSLGYAYPKAPHVKEVGGMNLNPPKPLPKDLQSFMDSADYGVIYFSYGSNVDMKQIMSPDKFNAFHDKFKSLKQKVLWKWAGEDRPKVVASNILVQEWFPQQDILAHKNCKLFITHGGLMSTIEAINYAVPLIGTAVFGDQPKNMRFIEANNLGINLQYDNITATSVSWAIDEILSNSIYKDSITRQSALFRDRPRQPVDEGVYWIEYVLKHGKVLQPQSVHMPFYQVYLLDIIAALLGTSIFIIYIASLACKALFSALCKKSTQQKLTKDSKKKR
ncbi:unnamed protein product [Nesidiocoris tenuis]|uniref:UDP-glucuronosyltransferase n=1 Tax=Nesidiocoris tenuis TaxID=355587 RepID=A0A6H5HPV8_9HEMI|nr:unnamed protein product [Nesidiocoris tenuis]